MDWHYLIQQIGAQTRRLRELQPDRNLIVAYLQAMSLSWPTWVKTQGSLAPQIVAAAVKPITDGLGPTTITLASHSGGGSFLFAYMAASPSIQGVSRMVFLDSDYDYDSNPAYGQIFFNWLTQKSFPQNCLIIVAYDDRNITINGKPVTCPTCGTWRHTHSFIRYLEKQPSIQLTHFPPDTNSTGPNNPIDTWLTVRTYSSENRSFL